MSGVVNRHKRAANRSGYRTYVCVLTLHDGPTACWQPPIKHELLDDSVYAYFRAVALDEDASRERSDADTHHQHAWAQREDSDDVLGSTSIGRCR